MSKSMEFWAACVKPGKAVPVTVEEGMTLRLTQCSLGETVKPGRSVLKVKASGKSCVLASLMADKIESSVLELMFEEGEVEFSVVGPNEIHLSGNMLDNDDGDDLNMMAGDDDDDEGEGSGGEDEDEDEDGDEDEDEGGDDSEEEAPPQKGAKKPKAAEKMEEDSDGGEDDEDDEEDEEDEDDGEEDEDEDEDEDDDDEEEEEEEEEKAVGQKRGPPAGKQAPASAGKQQKTPAKEEAKKGSPMASPRAREVPADVKAKIKKVLAGNASGIKGSDFPREWEKVHGKGGGSVKDAVAKCGFKKQAEMIGACPDVVRVEDKGNGNITFFPKK